MMITFLRVFCIGSAMAAGLVFAANAESTKTTVRIPVGEEVSLATDIYLPAGEGPFPCVLIRTPYNKANSKREGERFAKMGYAAAIQDTRGKFESDGVFYPFRNERHDGLRTVEWIRSQPWSNGKVAGWGGSYVGYTQWAIADQLDLLYPLLTTANMYEAMYPGGIYSLATTFNWGLVQNSNTTISIQPEKIIAAYSILPLSVADDSTVAQNDFLDDWLCHTFYDAYWGALDVRPAKAPPMISIAGWYDIFLQAQINDFIGLGEQRHPASRLVIGPYAHGKILIDTDFGDYAKLDRFEQAELRLMADVFAGREPAPADHPFSLFIMHKNQWIDCDVWPPGEARQTAYYFQPDGGLLQSRPAGFKKFEYRYDPLDPYISLGGTFLGVGVGPAVQNPNANRMDQVVFESPPLEKPLIIVGPISATLYAASDAPATDFFVSLQEVLKDGTILNIQEGGITYFGDDKCQAPAKKLEISLWATGIEIAAGKKLRVVVTSCLFPRYNRNLNSGEAIFSASKARPARQTIYVGADFPSKIMMPVLSGE